MAFTKIGKDLAIPDGVTAVYVFHGLRLCEAGPPSLLVRHAGDGTRGFKNASWHAANALRARGGNNSITEAKTRARCIEEAKLIADHCVVSWDNVVEDDGKPAPCTPAKVHEFLTAIIESDEGIGTYVAFRTWAQDADTFRPVPLGDATELGKG